MSAEKAVIEMLTRNTAIAGLVGDDIDPGILQQDTAPPAYVVSHISTVAAGHLNVTAGASEALASRVQITAVADTYPQVQDLIEAARAACGNRSGTFDGVTVRNSRIDLVGPDMKTPDDQWFMKTLDVRVFWIRAL
jgi:hypothetical protein